MTERDPREPAEDDDASDWLTSQFDPTGALPKQPPVPPAAPVPPNSAPTQPPTAAPPPQPPAAPAAPQQPIAPPSFADWQQPAAQQQPPRPPPPPVQVPPPSAPAFPLPPQQPAQPPVAPAFPVSPVVPVPPVVPAAPVLPAPAPPAPPAPPVPPTPPGAWFEPAIPTPHEPPPIDAAIAGIPPESQPPAEAMPFETTVLPDVAPDSRDAPPFWEPEPTQMMDVLELAPDPRPEEAPKQPFTRSVFPEGTELLPAAPAATEVFGAPPGETGAVSAIDSLFGETAFREYSDRPNPSENPFVRRAEQAAVEVGAPPPRPPGISQLQRILLVVLGSVLAVLALVGLFFLGIRLPEVLGPAPAIASPSASPSPSSPAVVVLGPLAPGEYRWNELLGGECLDPFVDAWQDQYVVVDCADPHAAQMVRTGAIPVVEPVTGTFDPDAYPGEDVLQTQTLGLCRVSGIFAPTAAALTDAQITASFPTAEQWQQRERAYYCFVTRSSGEPITGDLALPQVAPPVVIKLFPAAAAPAA